VKVAPYPQQENKFGFYYRFYEVSGSNTQMVSILQKDLSIELLGVTTNGDVRNPNPFLINTELQTFLENELDKNFPRTKPKR
jgi:hypothetical protein